MAAMHLACYHVCMHVACCVLHVCCMVCVRAACCVGPGMSYLCYMCAVRISVGPKAVLAQQEFEVAAVAYRIVDLLHRHRSGSFALCMVRLLQRPTTPATALCRHYFSSVNGWFVASHCFAIGLGFITFQALQAF